MSHEGKTENQQTSSWKGVRPNDQSCDTFLLRASGRILFAPLTNCVRIVTELSSAHCNVFWASWLSKANLVLPAFFMYDTSKVLSDRTAIDFPWKASVKACRPNLIVLSLRKVMCSCWSCGDQLLLTSASSMDTPNLILTHPCKGTDLGSFLPEPDPEVSS